LALLLQHARRGENRKPPNKQRLPAGTQALSPASGKPHRAKGTFTVSARAEKSQLSTKQAK
jgi:hypothetical protein